MESTPSGITYAGIPWPCDGTAEDMVAVMLSGEDQSAIRNRIKEIVLFWHPDKFFSRLGDNLHSKIGNGSLMQFSTFQNKFLRY